MSVSGLARTSKLGESDGRDIRSGEERSTCCTLHRPAEPSFSAGSSLRSKDQPTRRGQHPRAFLACPGTLRPPRNPCAYSRSDALGTRRHTESICLSRAGGELRAPRAPARLDVERVLCLRVSGCRAVAIRKIASCTTIRASNHVLFRCR